MIKIKLNFSYSLQDNPQDLLEYIYEIVNVWSHKMNIDQILKDHDLWVKTDGREGFRADLAGKEESKNYEKQRTNKNSNRRANQAARRN